MPLKKGGVYKCPKENCGCEVTVTKSAPATCSGNGPKGDCPILEALEGDNKTGRNLRQ